MQSVTILAVGKLGERYWEAACAEYQKRLSSFCRLQVVQIDEYRLPERPSPAEIALGLEREGARILQKIPHGAFAIPLCIEGRMLSSTALSCQLQQLGNAGRSHVVFIIGGSWGLSEAVKARGELALSISPMTFPHQLARVMLLEQLYRAYSIAAGAKYHK